MSESLYWRIYTDINDLLPLTNSHEPIDVLNWLFNGNIQLVWVLVGGVYCIFVTFPCGILGQVWYLIVFFDFSLTVKAAPHECVIRTGQP